MVLIHGIGGLYKVDGRKRSYWDYADLLVSSGFAVLVVDSHGARGIGPRDQIGSTAVSVYTFVADAFSGADILRTHPQIDSTKIGVMGFSKGGMTALLATDSRFVEAFSSSRTPFKVHIPIYPGCQNFPERLRSTNAPVFFLVGEKDNFTGISGCFEIEKKLREAGNQTKMVVYAGAFHGWDDSESPRRIHDLSSEDCRWVLRDDGGVLGGGTKRLDTPADGQAYFKSCLKPADIYVGRVEPANTQSRKAVVEIAKSALR